MGINWKIVAGSIGETLAERENEYRDYAYDYFTKRFDARQEEVSSFREKIKEQKKEFDRTNSTLRSAGLTNEQIAAGLDTMGKNFYSIVDQEISKLKGSEYGQELLAMDKTGGAFRDYVRNKFDEKLVSPDQRTLDLSDVVANMLDKLPEQAEMRNVPQSIFGFDYTGGIREDIKGLGKEFANIPQYDSVAPIEGVDVFLSAGIPSVPEEAMFTSAQLDKRIKSLVVQRHGGLAINETGTFTTSLEDKKEASDLKRLAEIEAQAILDKYNELRNANKRVLTEGGKTDAQILRDAVTELGMGAVSPRSQDRAGLDDQTGVAQFNIGLSDYVNKFGGSTIAKVTTELKGEDIGFDDAQVASILQSVAQGKTTREILKNIPDGPAKVRIANLLRSITTEDKEIIKGFGTVTESTEQTEKPETTDGGDAKEAVELLEGAVARPNPADQTGRGRTRLEDMAEIWDEEYGAILNPDGSPREGFSEAEIAAGLAIAKSKYDKRVAALISLNPFD